MGGTWAYTGQSNVHSMTRSDVNRNRKSISSPTSNVGLDLWEWHVGVHDVKGSGGTVGRVGAADTGDGRGWGDPCDACGQAVAILARQNPGVGEGQLHGVKGEGRDAGLALYLCRH